MNNDRKENNGRKSIDIPNFINYEEIDDSNSFLRDVKDSLSEQVSSIYEEKKAPSARPRPVQRRRKKRKSKLSKVVLSLLAFVLLLSVFLFLTTPGKRLIIHMAGNYIYSKLDYQPAQTSEATNGDGLATSVDSSLPDSPVINILLLGVEEIGGARNTDSMMIATMNTIDHTVKLTSIMRDLYVDIPDHDKNKLNSAYAKGGVSLLYNTIYNNFKIPLDGYCMVNFNTFQKLVDLVGGVEIKLTKEEAKYLNTTNYISKKSNRNVKAGVNLMNGNQALGYCRVRKVSTGTENNDFGRTQRQRVVLQAIYDKIRSKNILQQAALMNKILSEVGIQTDIKRNDFNRYLEEAVSLKLKELKTFRIPTDGSFDNAKVRIGSYNVAVLVPKDWDATRKELHDFIYDDLAETADSK